MPNNTERIHYLLNQFIANNVSAEEARELFALLKAKKGRAPVKAIAEQLWKEYTMEGTMPAADWEKMYTTIVSIPVIGHSQKNRKGILRIAVAAAILVIAGVALYFLFKGSPQKATAIVHSTGARDVAPGSNGAILTLADGSTIVLDSATNGIITTQGNTQVVLNNGRLVYNPGTSATEKVIYNTMTTPRGRQFHIKLPDGTGVWLNAASSITYPAAFTGKERKVAIKGEAYFEVAPAQLRSGFRMPFKVTIDDQAEIEVLGTHFNVNAYTDEASINTTLLEGSVRVGIVNRQSSLSDSRSVVKLTPGQQAQIPLSSPELVEGSRPELAEGIQVQTVDVAQVVAWKNGGFDFHRVRLEAVMRQLARWYDVEIVYEKNIPDIEFGGKMGRDLQLSQVLEGLGEIGVHFRIEDGKRLVVMP